MWPAGAGRLCKRVVKKVLRFDGPCGAEGGIALWGVRVQRVQKVQRVQRVVVAAGAADLYDAIRRQTSRDAPPLSWSF